MKNNLIYSGIFLIIWSIFQFAFVVGVKFQTDVNQTRFISSIEKRIAIDLPKLRLANPKFKTVADSRSINAYMSNLNDVLKERSSSVFVTAIQDISNPSHIKTVNDIETVLHTNDQEIKIQYRVAALNVSNYLSIFPLLFAAIFSLLCIRKLRFAQIKTNNEHETQQGNVKHQLIIDLKTKTLSYIDLDSSVALPNKPFCFYAALIDFCMHDNTANLSSSSNIPDELIQTANKYFYRLIELGHTKRKRPDFAANLDKTLSEIRSALDEIFAHHQDEKEYFYPPKAQGEGSRSKLHNFALTNIDPNKVLFIGK